MNFTNKITDFNLYTWKTLWNNVKLITKYHVKYNKLFYARIIVSVPRKLILHLLNILKINLIQVKNNLRVILMKKSGKHFWFKSNNNNFIPEMEKKDNAL